MVSNIISITLLTIVVICLIMTIICAPDKSRHSLRFKIYAYLFEHDDIAIWKYVNSRKDDIKFERSADFTPYDSDFGKTAKAFHFTLSIPEYKSLKLKGEQWKEAVKYWDNGNLPELRIILWMNEKATSVHWEAGCLASDWYAPGSDEMTEFLLEKFNEVLMREVNKDIQ